MEHREFSSPAKKGASSLVTFSPYLQECPKLIYPYGAVFVVELGTLILRDVYLLVAGKDWDEMVFINISVVLLLCEYPSERNGFFFQKSLAIVEKSALDCGLLSKKLPPHACVMEDVSNFMRHCFCMAIRFAFIISFCFPTHPHSLELCQLFSFPFPRLSFIPLPRLMIVAIGKLNSSIVFAVCATKDELCIVKVNRRGCLRYLPI